MKFWEFIHIPLGYTDDSVLTHAGVADDEDVEVRVQVRRSPEVRLHLHRGRDGEYPRPLTEEQWRFEVIGVRDEVADPRVQLPLAVGAFQSRCSL